MQSGPSVSLSVLVLCAALFGQSATPAAQPQTFHVRGTVTDPLGAAVPGAEITFNGEQTARTTMTNASGRYEIDLPLGRYTMKAERRGLRTYRRPLFLVSLPTDLMFDITLPVGQMVDRIIAGKVVSERSDQPFNYYGEEFLPLPSKDGVPFQVFVRYFRRTATDDHLEYTDEKTPYEEPVLVAYNLFSLQADKVIYDAQKRTIEASGNVIAVNELGATQHSNSMAFKIEDGQVALLP
jgi:hypothetical protein